MPVFHIHFQDAQTVTPDDVGIEFRDLETAYLDARAAIPTKAKALLLAGRDPLACSYVICDAKGRRLLDLPFTEYLSPSEWRMRQARRRPHGGIRSAQARDDLALTSFRRIFKGAEAGTVLLTPEMTVTEISDFGARHSHVDPDAVRGSSILDIFVDLKGQPKTDFTDFMMLARAGAVSEVLNLPYHVLDETGRSAMGWWNARTWPIFDDDDQLLGLVEWAMPFVRPTASGDTLVRITPGSTL